MKSEQKPKGPFKASEKKRQRLSNRGQPDADESGLLAFLELEIWPQIPPRLLGTRLSKAEKEAILGYGPDGV